MVQLTDKIIAVEVQDNAQEPDIRHGRLIWVTDNSVDYLDLPPGTWQFLFTTKEATEEQARKVVETIHVEYAPSPYNDFAGNWDVAYVDYENPGEFAGWCGDAGYCRKAIDSLQSLLKAKGCDINKNQAILIKSNEIQL